MDNILTPSSDVLNALNEAFINPARNLNKSRGKNIHRYTSVRMEVKMNRKVSVESTLEYYACHHFDFSTEILRFCSQPIRYSYILDGKEHTYVPDFLVQFNDGEFIFYEVKNDVASSSKSFKVEFEAKRIAAEKFGIALELVTESQIKVAPLLHNLKLIHRYASRNNVNKVQQNLLTILRQHGSLRVESLMVKADMSRLEIMPILCNLLSKHIIETDLYSPLSINMEIGLVHA